MQIIIAFEERLSGFWRNIFVREAVVAVGIGRHFYGFSIEKQPETWLPERSFILLDTNHNSFWRKAEWFLA